MTHFSRRAFLRGLGASACLMPLLPSQVLGADTPIKRFVFVFTPNGTVLDAWQPKEGYKLGPILSPLESMKSKMAVLRNIDMKTTYTSDYGSAHSKGIGHCLTGIELLPGPFKGGSGKPCGWSKGISVDQHIGQALRAKHKLQYDTLTLGVDAKGNQVRTTVSYLGENQPKLPQNNPFQLYKDLFGGASTSTDQMDRLRKEQRSVLDLIKGDLGRVQGKLGQEDRQKVESHLSHIREIEGRLDTVATQMCNPDPLTPGADPEDKDDKFFPQLAELQIEMLVAALSCDVTRVATLQFSTATSTQTFPWLSISDKHHDLSHLGDSNTAAQSKLVKINTWYAQQLAKLAGALEAVPEGTGTMLDHTVILWGNELGKGNTHTRKDIPYLMIGGADGFFKTGQVLDAKGASHNDLLISLCRAMEVDLQKGGTFGDPKFCNGGLKIIES